MIVCIFYLCTMFVLSNKPHMLTFNDIRFLRIISTISFDIHLVGKPDCRQYTLRYFMRAYYISCNFISSSVPYYKLNECFFFWIFRRKHHSTDDNNISTTIIQVKNNEIMKEVK